MNLMNEKQVCETMFCSQLYKSESSHWSYEVQAALILSKKSSAALKTACLGSTAKFGIKFELQKQDTESPT